MGKYADQPFRGSKAAEMRARALCARAKPDALVVELGTMTGAMMIEALRIRPDLCWIAVDNWLPAEQQPLAYKQTRDDNALKSRAATDSHRELFYARAGKLGASVMRMSTAQAAPLFAYQSVDIVFVDADHSYEGVREDIRLWQPKVAPGGWLGGHDYQNIDPRFGGVDRAVNELFPRVETDLNYTWWVNLR